MVLPRNRKYQSITLIGPCSCSSWRPVSSVTSRRAASAGGSPGSRWPLGKPQFLYESRIKRKRTCPSGPRRKTTPPALVSRCARGWDFRDFERRGVMRIRNAEVGTRNSSAGPLGERHSGACSALHIPRSELSLEDAEREVLAWVRLNVRKQLP